MAKKDEIVKVESEEVQPIEHIDNLIHEFRGQQVMLDRDLAMLYGVETKRLNDPIRQPRTSQQK